MEVIKLVLRHHLPRPYKFLYNIKQKILKIIYVIKQPRPIKKFKTTRLIKQYQFNKKLAQRIAILGCMQELHSALEAPHRILNKECDAYLIVMLVVSALRVDPRVERQARADAYLIVMLVVSALRVDPRVERQARALATNGYRVIVICPDMSMPRLREQPLNWGKNIEFDILDTEAAGYVNDHPWLQGKLLLQSALRYKPMAFHCHDLNTALIGLTAARKVGTQCVCDFHEWYSENVSWDYKKERWVPHPKIKRKFYQAAEALVMARADSVITVCDSIANELETNHTGPKRKVHVIRNIPSVFASDVHYPSLRDQLNIPGEKLILLWQGGTGPTRLLEPVIQSLIYVKNVVLVIRGPSLEYYGESYLKEATQAGVSDRLHLLPPVKSADVVNATYGADVGVWTLPNFCKNFYYALPNKLFEYLTAGLPVICANFPEVRTLVERYRVGTVFDPYNPKSIANALTKFNDVAFREKCRQNTALALSEIKADQEWNKLVSLYNQLREERVPQ